MMFTRFSVELPDRVRAATAAEAISVAGWKLRTLFEIAEIEVRPAVASGEWTFRLGLRALVPIPENKGA